MILKTSVAVLALLLGGGVAMAETKEQVATATSAEQCLKQSFELADKIEGRNLTDVELDRLDDLLSEMESHCESNRFVDAAAIATAISDELSTQKQ